MTALLYKRFWAQGDFWADPGGKGRGLFWDFLKNLSLGAGFLLIVVGTDGSGLAPFLAHPFASSHPYRSVMSDPADERSRPQALRSLLASLRRSRTASAVRRSAR